MKAKTRLILDEAIEEGLRGFLHNDLNGFLARPLSEAQIDYLMDHATNRIWLAIDEHFSFSDEVEEY